MNETKIILGIETSCDDTSISIIEGNTKESPKVLFHNKFSQELLLKKWGGVVPEIAARNHMAKLTPLLEECFTQAKIDPKDIDGISVTTIPGLLGPLLTGLNAAKTISLITEKPIIAINHLFAHLEAIHLTENISYPYIGMLVSGGHTIFFQVNSSTDFKVLGGTIDDAAGEAFDKGGKLLGLGYPAGVIIDRYAKWGDENRFDFPIAMKNDPSPKMSFSGIKTAIRVFMEKHNDELIIPENELFEKDEKYQFLFDVCASYQKAIVDTLILKLKKAQKISSNKYPIVVGGGVACNSYLRSKMLKTFKNTHFVKPEFCTDNGAMIANMGLRNFNQATPFPACLELDARGRYIDKGNK